MIKSFLIIGMGSFGHHLCNSLIEQDCEIMVVDDDEENLEDVLSVVTSARIGDCTNKEVLKSFSVNSFDACFVCVGNNFQNSLQITSLLQELGAKHIYSRANEDIQAKFLLRNGADEVIYPEKDVAEEIAISVASDNVFDVMEISNDFFVMEINPCEEWIGKTILELNFRKQYNLNIMATKIGKDIFPMPNIDYVFKKDEHLLVLGHIDDIKKIV